MKRNIIIILVGSLLFLTACTTTTNEDPPINNVDDNEGNHETIVNNENNNEGNRNEENVTNNHDNDDLHNDDDEPSILDSQDPSIILLVNKENALSPDDHPTDLVTITVPYVLDNPEINQMRKEAADALESMFAAAKEENILLYARSGFRSYQTQEQLFQSYVERNGVEAANRYSAKPGQSEHQTGLVMDITSESVNLNLTESFGETEEGIWVKNHAHEFGFIVRYPEGKEHITGYIYEPWHLRYLGIDVATQVYESGLTYEEFIESERSDK